MDNVAGGGGIPKGEGSNDDISLFPARPPQFLRVLLAVRVGEAALLSVTDRPPIFTANIDRRVAFLTETNICNRYLTVTDKYECQIIMLSPVPHVC